MSECSPVSHGAGGRIENRVKIPDGTATVSVEVMRVTKVGHWGFPEKAGAWLLRRKSGDLLSMPHSPLSDRRGRILLSEKRPERHFAAAPAFSCRLPPCGVFCTTDGFAGPSPFLSPGGIPPGDKNLKKGQLKGIAPGIGSRYNRRCISAERSKRQIPICKGVGEAFRLPQQAEKSPKRVGRNGK